MSQPAAGAERSALPRQVVVPLDGSETGARALPLAHAIAGRTGAEVVTVHVGAALEDVGRVDVVLEGDDPAGALLAFTHERTGRVLCVSSHGRTGLRRALLGSVAERLVRHAHAPVIAVGPDVEIRPPMILPRTIVVAVGSGRDEHGVAELAGRWAPLLGAELDLVHVGEQEPAVTNLEGIRLLPGGDPAQALLGLGDELPGPLLYAVGAPDRDGQRPGRTVALQLIRNGRWPVLTRTLPED